MNRAEPAPTTIRDLSGIAEMKASEALQRAVWGQDDPPDNADLLMSIQHEGGLVAGAFQGARMVGFLFGFPTAAPGIQHSHRLAIHPSARGLGLGARLKWYQRDWCLARGIGRVRWTYDPLRAINARLNIGHLGARASEYLVDYYGPMEGINAGLPSDRLVADWDLGGAAAIARADGLPLPGGGGERRRAALPADIDGLLAAAPARALEERLRLRAELTAAFADGWQICGFDPAGPAYVLMRMP